MLREHRREDLITKIVPVPYDAEVKALSGRHTSGVISKLSMDQLTEFVLNKYNSVSSHAKVLGFTKSFLKYLTKTRLDTRYYAFAVFLDRPRTIVERKNVTSRIVTRADIEYILKHVDQSEAADQSIPSGALSSPHPIWRIFRTTIDGHYSTTHDRASSETH